MSFASDPSAFDLESILRGTPKPVGAPPAPRPAPRPPTVRRRQLGCGLLSAGAAPGARASCGRPTASRRADARPAVARAADPVRTSETLVFAPEAIRDAGAKPPLASGAPFALAAHHRVLLGSRLAALRSCAAALLSTGAAVSLRSTTRRSGSVAVTLAATSEDAESSVAVDTWSLPEREGREVGVVVELRRAGGDKGSFYGAVDAFQAALETSAASAGSGVELVRDVTDARVPRLSRAEATAAGPTSAGRQEAASEAGPASSGVGRGASSAVPAGSGSPVPGRRRVLGGGLLSAGPARSTTPTTGRRRTLGSGLLGATPSSSAAPTAVADEPSRPASEWRSWLGAVESMLDSRFADVRADGAARAARELADVAAAAVCADDGEPGEGRVRAWREGVAADGTAGRLTRRLVKAQAESPGSWSDAALALSGLVCLATSSSSCGGGAGAALVDAGAAHALCASVVRPAERATVRSRRAATEALGRLAAADGRVAEVAERAGATAALRLEVATSAGGDRAMAAVAEAALSSLRAAASEAALAAASGAAAGAADA